MAYNPFSHERLAYDAAKSLEHVLGDAKPLRDLRLTRRAQRVQNKYGRGWTVRLAAEFVPDGGEPWRGRLCLVQREPQPSWRTSRFRSGVTVTVLPGEPTASGTDSVAWRARIDGQEGSLALPLEFAAAVAAHLTQRPAAGG